MSTRLKYLQATAVEEPNDPFNHYALAIELAKDSPSEAYSMMESVKAHFPYYLPAWQWLASKEEENEHYQSAAVYLRDAIRLAKTIDQSLDIPYLKDFALQKIKTELEKALYNLEIQGLIE